MRETWEDKRSRPSHTCPENCRRCVDLMLARMLGAARLSVDTYEDVEHDNGATIQALAVVIIVSIAFFVGQVAGRRRSPNVVSALLVGIVRGVVSWAVWALFTYDDRGHDLEDRGHRGRLGTAGPGHRLRPDPGDTARLLLYTCNRGDHLNLVAADLDVRWPWWLPYGRVWTIRQPSGLSS